MDKSTQLSVLPVVPMQTKPAEKLFAQKPFVNPLLPHPPQLCPERATLRRLAEELEPLLTPLEVLPGPAGAYRAATAPAPMLALLDYVAELQQQLVEARRYYQDNVQELLLAWKNDCHALSPPPFFELKCRELTGRALDETAAPVVLPQPWPAAAPNPTLLSA